MATKILLTTSTYSRLLARCSRTHCRPLLKKSPRCFTSSFPTMSQPIVTKLHEYHPHRHDGQLRSISCVQRATRSEHDAFLRLNKAPPYGLLNKRLLSDSKTEEENKESVSSTTDTEKDNLQSQTLKKTVGKQLRKCSESPTEETETVVLDRQSEVNDQEERAETYSKLHRFGSETGDVIETSEDITETSEDITDISEDINRTVSSSLVIRTKPDENELDRDWGTVDILAERESPTVLEEFIQPLLPTESLSLAAYADHSPTLQKLTELGVDLSKVEKKAKIGNALIKMDFDRDIKDKIVLLDSAGVTSSKSLGRFLTINPFVLTEDLENLETRLRYLRSKKFSDDAITQVLTRAPYFLSFSVDRLDSKLGFYQKELSLTGDEIRHIITKTPKLVTFKIQRVKESIFVFRRQLGFTTSELKKLVLAEPKLLLRGKEKLIGVFDYLHNHMGIPHKQIVKNPQVFNGRAFKLQERHQFLKLLGRAQYDPTQPGYVALEHLSKVPDAVFCQDIAKSSIEVYNDFLKTL
ncbi:transcription termination factor 3, mitochondrial-like [Acanthaster planci]|uniref:Transcription termination factor 3, mitochondrial n=1 Tax=Acanthaster planci TaxID=133434 RepID=A0A8B7Z9J1_ACAPL|nr:transcription termination factor 3, mitochondrial-like [Acanthaster planci]XP_022101469.1 transcription termination factor 3, mitochondrial-like [Acanthaster planci]XP_022101470.1 transcription termination factor 3, mitochondrial-like [Acanthaster planci]XP_022101471.1 transcription termination factor 3, mitochondrial-like [Acanthaster planci]